MNKWSKHIGLVLLLCLGFFLAPGISYACAAKKATQERASCSKDKSIQKETKDCCKTKSCQKDKDQNDCNGKCKHNSCKCSASASSFSLPAALEFKTKHFADIQKQKFSFNRAYYSSGYASIWQPPKIS